MEETLKDNLLKCFKYAGKKQVPFVYVVVRLPEHPAPELIINTTGNFKKKMKYYDKAYTDDLKLKTNEDVKIVGYGVGESLYDIQNQLAGGIQDTKKLN